MRSFFLCLLLCILCLTTGCSRMVLNRVSDAISSGGSGSSLIMGDNDPEFMSEAMPLALKMIEGLLLANPDHEELHASAASGFAAYAYAFIQFEADTLPYALHGEQRQSYVRARNMYLRARDYGLKGLELRYPGFAQALGSNPDSLMALMEEEDCDLLYWTGLSWMGAFTVDKFNMRLALSTPQAVALLMRVAELSPDYGNGLIDEFLITFYGSMPPSMGGDKEKSRIHFDRAVQLSEGTSAAPYIAYAAVAILDQDVEEFRSLLTTAQKIKPIAIPEAQLLRILQHEKASWYLRNEDRFFLTTDELAE